MLLCTTHTGTVTRSFFCRLAYLFSLRANKGEINGFYFSFLTEFFFSSPFLNYTKYVYKKKKKQLERATLLAQAMTIISMVRDFEEIFFNFQRFLTKLTLNNH